MKEFTVKNCEVVEVILGNAGCRKLEGNVLTKEVLLLVEKVAFPSLETLHTTSMGNIKMAWDNQVAANSFPNPKSLCIQECN